MSSEAGSTGTPTTREEKHHSLVTDQERTALIAELRVSECDSDLKTCRENWPSDPASWCIGCQCLAAADALAALHAPRETEYVNVVEDALLKGSNE